MRTKVLFLLVGGASVLGLVVWGLVGLLDGSFAKNADAVAGYGVGISFVFGLLTVWGLFWAASEFSEQSVRPRLTLFVGSVKQESGKIACDPIRDPVATVRGHTSASDTQISGRLNVGLFVENYAPKAAKNIRVVVEADSQPSPCYIEQWVETFEYKCHPNMIDNRILMMQFEDALIVYRGHGVYIGVLRLHWQGVSLPSAFKLKYTIYKYEGEPDSGQCHLAVEWFPESAEMVNGSKSG